MKIKQKKIVYQVFDDEGELQCKYGYDEFDTIKEAKEFIERHTMGGNFTIYKIIKSMKPIKIYKKGIVPCHGGWYGGHTISQEDVKNETKNPYCTRCGYKLRVIASVFNSAKLVTLKPLQRKDNKLMMKKK